jgi:hypothetical protein
MLETKQNLRRDCRRLAFVRRVRRRAMLRRSSANAPQCAGAARRKAAMSTRRERYPFEHLPGKPDRTAGNLTSCRPLDRVDGHTAAFVAATTHAGVKRALSVRAQPREPDRTAGTLAHWRPLDHRRE